VKRLLLENILLLSNRRVPTNDLYDLDHVEANKVLKEIYGKSLQKIFDYYLDIANKRRNHALTAEKIVQRDIRASTNRDVSSLSISKATSVLLLKEQAKLQKDFIGYKEYIQVLLLVHSAFFHSSFFVTAFFVVLS
jgi:hypothetical protein